MIDQVIQAIHSKEKERLNNDIELIASENYPSQDILDLLGSYFSVKYAEGFPKEVSKQGRHYAGCENIDLLEIYAIAKAKELFNVKFANVQSHSGSQANQAVYAGLLKQGDTILSMSIESGGHLTHGSKASATSQYYNFVHYGLDENGDLNYDEIKEKLYKHRPQLLLVGASAFSKRIDYERIRKIVDEYNGENCYEKYEKYLIEEYDNKGMERPQEMISFYKFDKCYLMSDSAHVMGFIAAHMWKDKYDPTKWCDVVTSTTHKTLRGPRGGLILWNDENLCSKINSGVFPKIQGGPNEALVAAKAQCFIEALRPEFKDYMEQVYHNMQALINGIKAYDSDNRIGFVSGGSENHLVLLDLKKSGINGKEAEDRLTSYGIITNKNMIAGDDKPSTCTGLRIGTAAITTRGFTEEMCYSLGGIIAKIILKKEKDEEVSVIDFEDEYIKTTLRKMMDKVGPFYGRKQQIQDNNPVNPDDLA